MRKLKEKRKAVQQKEKVSGCVGKCATAKD